MYLVGGLVVVLTIQSRHKRGYMRDACHLHMLQKHV